MRSFRKERVASVIRDVISNALDHRMQDPRIGPLTTVTRVEVTGDLQLAKIFLGVQGDDSCERRTLIAVRHAGGYLRKMVADVITLRMCPELRFEIDDGVKQTRDILKLLDENLRDNPSLAYSVDDQSEGDEAEDSPDESVGGGSSETIEDHNP
jgi:ribosome-binding factor A